MSNISWEEKIIHIDINKLGGRDLTCPVKVYDVYNSRLKLVSHVWVKLVATHFCFLCWLADKT